MPANGATATSSAVAGNVRFKAVAELTSMAEMRRRADVATDMLALCSRSPSFPYPTSANSQSLNAFTFRCRIASGGYTT